MRRRATLLQLLLLSLIVCVVALLLQAKQARSTTRLGLAAKGENVPWPFDLPLAFLVPGANAIPRTANAAIGHCEGTREILSRQFID